MGWLDCKLEKMKMIALGLIYRAENVDCIEKRIPFSAHRSSETLKSEVRKAMCNYREMGCHLVKLYSRGPFIYLKFRRTPKTSAI